MEVSGDQAKEYNAIRLDSFKNANLGELISADEQTGHVAWRDKAGELKTVTLGSRAIKIMRK